MLKLLLLLVLLIWCWPLALLALAAYLIFWLIQVPFQLLGAMFHSTLAWATVLIFLSARLLYGKPVRRL